MAISLKIASQLGVLAAVAYPFVRFVFERRFRNNLRRCIDEQYEDAAKRVLKLQEEAGACKAQIEALANAGSLDKRKQRSLLEQYELLVSFCMRELELPQILFEADDDSRQLRQTDEALGMFLRKVIHAEAQLRMLRMRLDNIESWR